MVRLTLFDIFPLHAPLQNTDGLGKASFAFICSLFLTLVLATVVLMVTGETAVLKIQKDKFTVGTLTFHPLHSHKGFYIYPNL